MVPEKICPRCETSKPLTEYGSNRSRKDGLQPYCRPCYLDYLRRFKRGWRRGRNQPVAVEQKTCTRCGETKAADDFKRNRSEADGLCSWCRDCQNEYSRRYLKTDVGRASVERSTARHQVRVRARKAVNHAVERGDLQSVSRCDCVQCGGQAEEYHHPSYARDRWLDVVPLCKRCHGAIHSQEEVMPSCQQPSSSFQHPMRDS